MEVIAMTKRKLLLLLMTTGLLGGCAATLTPTGDIYTEALLPVESTTVVVESYPLLAYGPRYRPAPPRGGLRPGPHFAPHGPAHYRPHARYAAPGHHRAPGQHRAPGVKGPRTSHGSGPILKAGSGPQGPQARGGQPRTSGFSGRPQGSRGPQSNSHGSSSRGPR